MVLSDARVRQILRANGVNPQGFQLSDEKFKTVSVDFIHEAHGEWVISRPKKFQRFEDGETLPVWLRNKRDCENHSYSFFAYCNDCNGLTDDDLPEEDWSGLLLGVCYYVAKYKPENQRRGGHAVNLLIDHEENLQFFEPADKKIIQLDRAERKSIWDGVFI